MTRAIGLVRGYTGAFGTSLGDAGKGLNEMFADPVKGAEKLNEKLGFLNARTLDYITTPRNEGDVQGAIRAAMDAASVSLNAEAKEVTGLAKVMRDASIDAERFRDAVGKFVFGSSDPMERLHEAESRLNHPDMISLMEQSRRSADEFKRDPEGSRGRALMATGATRYGPATDPWTMSEDIRRASQLRDMQLRDLIANQQSLSARDITRSNSPEMLERQKLQEDRDSLAKSLVTTLQATKDATQAAADAERVRAEAVADARKRLDESERNSINQMALIGLNPTQRILEEAKQGREALKRDNEIPAGAATLAAGVRPGAAVPLVGGAAAASGPRGDASGGDLHVHVYGGSGDDHIRGLVRQGVSSAIASNNRALPGMLADRQTRRG